ncbi:hypothetical protein KFL_001370140 [Klebsormidium nitens]|uniref:Coiled-coil SMC6 And NSE5 INteracting (CANIN) domain-containing protein n=1 Tax=Klebsormidium nitens TaxID=105231 RepID=A0A1Y1HWW5_KLENI|nr:hypothetical protein KFL_001370140 [Klebsormidium nitens]|eukprot:GAQ83144.1 hypothetical protein KFL_001370140 [Klebsormidium nitens]
MGRAGKAKAEDDLTGSPAKRGVGRSGRGAVRTLALKDFEPLEDKATNKTAMSGAKGGGRKTSTGSNADTSKALSALERLLNDRKKKAAAAQVEKAEVESSDESDLEIEQKTEKDNAIVEKLEEVASYMKRMKGGEDDTAALPKWGETHFNRQGPIQHGHRLEEVLDTVAPDDADIWFETSAVLKEMEESSTEAKQEVVKALLTGGGLRAHLFNKLSVDSKALRWLFNLVCYSPEDMVERAAFCLLADIIGGGSKVAALAGVSDAYLTSSTCGASFLDRPRETRLDLGWVPNLSDFREVFNAYGYVEKAVGEASADISDDSDAEGEAGPSGVTQADEQHRERIPSNVCSLLRLITVLATARSTIGTFSAKDTEGLVVLLARASLDHQLVFATETLQAAIQALTDSFTDSEWKAVGPRLTKTLSRLSGRYINNVRIVVSWPCASARSLDLQRALAFALLVDMFKKTRVEKSVRGVVSLFKPVNFKDADCVILMTQLRLADVYLRHLPALADDLDAAQSWVQVLRSVLSGVKHIDPRPGAGDVRQLASFALIKYDDEVDKLEDPRDQQLA